MTHPRTEVERREAVAAIVAPGVHWQRENTVTGKRIYAEHWQEALSKADQIQALYAAEIEGLRRALEPFAVLSKKLPDGLASHVEMRVEFLGSTGRRKVVGSLPASDFRQASESLQQINTEGKRR